MEWKSNSMEVLARNMFDIGFKYTWKISNYLKCSKDEENVDSPLFSINVNGLTTKWSISLRYWTDEHGVRLTNPVVVCLNLVSASGCKEQDVEKLQVRYQFGIFDNDIKQYEVCPIGTSFVDISPENQNLQIVGKRDIMILDRHLNPGNYDIELFCKIMLIKDNSQTEDEHSLIGDLWGKLKSGEDCDVKIRSNDHNEIPCHKIILSSRSKVIKNMIDNEGLIKLDLSTPMLTSLLQYIYTDRIDPLESPEKLIRFAVKLELPGLKNICEKALIDQIAPSTLASLLMIADTFHCENLKKSALLYCGENPHAIGKTVAWKVMEEINPKLFEQVCDQI